jgi:hypothetical protein
MTVATTSAYFGTGRFQLRQHHRGKHGVRWRPLLSFPLSSTYILGWLFWAARWLGAPTLGPESRHHLQGLIEIRVTLSLMLRPTVSRNKAHIWGLRPHFITVRQLRVCLFEALSLTRGQVCHLQLPLVLVSSAILESESRGVRDHILLSKILGFRFLRLLRLTGLRWRNSTSPPHGIRTGQSLNYVMTDYQSASLSWNKANIWGLRPDSLQDCWCGAVSLTKGRVCRLPESQRAVISMLSVCTIYILHAIKCMYVQHIQGASQSRLSTGDRALSLVTPATTEV